MNWDQPLSRIPPSEPVKPLAVGELVAIPSPRGVTLTGRIVNVNQLHSPNGPAGFVIQCAPEREGGQGA